MNDPVIPQQRQFARYSLTRELRREPSTTIYLALDPVMHREVVLKVVHLPPPSDATAHKDAELAPLEQAFVRQAQAAGKLNHPHIVTVFEAGRLNSQGYLAIERVNGRPLDELIAAGWRPQLVHAASIAARVADAIEHAHSQDVAHGHLGPQHVLLQADGVPKVEGFGGWIDNGAGGDDALHRTERLLPYFQNELTDEMRSRDVRAVAALGYLMVSGRAPAANAAPLASVRSDVPGALARLNRRHLEPGGRPRTPLRRRPARRADRLHLERAQDNVRPATLGIPLAAPPRQPAAAAAPRTVGAAPRTTGGSARTAGNAPRTLGGAAAPAEIITRTVEPAAQPRSLEHLSTVRTSLSAGAAPGAVRQHTATLRSKAPAEPARAWLEAITTEALPWLRKNPLAMGAVGAFVVAAVVLAVLLATFAGHKAAPSPAADVTAPVAAAAPPPLGEGALTLDIAPWGEVIVDGKPMGVSPPMTELRLPAGRHAIEIRYGKTNGETAAVTAQVDIDPATPMQIRHRFE